MKIINHLLSEDKQLYFNYQTPNLGGEFASGAPDTIVLHYTAGTNAQSSAEHLTKASKRSSAHLVIGREGEIYQLAPFNRITWHAGKSQWQGRKQLNNYAIGIEMDNAGELTEQSSGIYKTWFGKVIDRGDVFIGKHRNLQQSKLLGTATLSNRFFEYLIFVNC